MFALVSCLLLVAASPRTAEDPQVRAGITAFDELRYRDSITLLERAAELPTLSRDDRIAALSTMARAQAILKRPDDARAAFTRVLELDPAYLVGYDEPPVVTQSFQAARQDFERAHPGLMRPDALATAPPPALRVWPWVAAGVGVAAVAVIVTVLVVTHDNNDVPSGVNDVWRLP